MARRVAACAVCEQHAEAVFHVEGMDCHEEVGLLERRLKPLAGLEALAADVVGRRLHVKYDAARLTPDAMVAAVGPIGLRMRLAHEPARVADSLGGHRLLGPIAAGVGPCARAHRFPGGRSLWGGGLLSRCRCHRRLSACQACADGPEGVHAGYPRADARRGGGSRRARRAIRGGKRRLSLCPGPVARGAHARARPPGDRHAGGADARSSHAEDRGRRDQCRR